MATKLWDKGFEPDKMIEEYTVGNDRELDMRLARYDVQGSLAHIAMLETIGLLTAGELEKLTAGLKEIAAEIEAGRFEIEPGTEDVHSQVELMLTRRLGDAGKKIHSGRSRNDQVLVDLKLFLRDELRQTAEAVKTVFDRLQTLSVFPTIFALGLEGMGVYTKKASSYIVMGVAGGAFSPMLMGYIGEENMALGFIVPLIAFLYILYFAIKCKR